MASVVNRLGQYIGKLIVGVDVCYRDRLHHYLLSNVVISNFNVFRAFV